MNSEIERLKSDNEQLKSQIENLRGLLDMSNQAIQAFQAQIDFRDNLLLAYTDAVKEANRVASLEYEKSHPRGF